LTRIARAIRRNRRVPTDALFFAPVFLRLPPGGPRAPALARAWQESCKKPVEALS
jgi:hypothetical protein